LTHDPRTAQPGDRQRYEQDVRLITDFQGKLYAFVMSLVGRSEDAEEIVQRTNLVIWRKLPEFEHRSSFSTWACGIAKREVLAWRRSRNDLLLDEASLEQVADVAQKTLNEDRPATRFLSDCMKKMPEHARSLLKMRYDEQLTSEEIGKRIDRSEGNVRVMLHRIRQALADCIRRAGVKEREA
jgi:RNA polymerase sigma-70 factor (ECF subfamily)